jgi:hypothetical protein
MAPPRTFDYELLKRLLREHPDWPMYLLAKTLSEDNWTRNPHAQPVRENAVATAISKHRFEWQFEGVPVGDRRNPIYDDLIPPTWKVAEGQRMHIHLRKLRTLGRLRRGTDVGSDPKGERQALQFEGKLRETSQVVDISPKGVPYLRSAEPWELDEDGNLLDVVGRAKPADWPARKASLTVLAEPLAREAEYSYPN